MCGKTWFLDGRVEHPSDGACSGEHFHHSAGWTRPLGLGGNGMTESGMIAMTGERCGVMSKPKIESRWLRCVEVLLLVFFNLAGEAATPPKAACTRVVFEGQASAGGYWTVPLGQGWVFRVLPITPLHAAYSGWGPGVDRKPAAGFPDALLLATMPYNSINEREIGTTFGLRAQD